MVSNGDVAYATGRQVHGHRRTQATCAHHQHMAVDQALLAFDAHIVKQDVARIAQQLVVVHRRFTSELLVFLLSSRAHALRLAGQHGLAFQAVEGLL